MNNHQKGPWDLANYTDRKTGAVYLAVWAGKTAVCLLSPKETETETDYANGALIAAAPELLEHMKRLIDIIWRYPELDAELKLALEIIDKAHIESYGSE
jgi:hypothetical protein